ncbi:hypothetical protein HYFRA_00012563 [Hymenoscyphus fraxineus]|uniref:JmjC domain-containing protein n=1 Tax=Hymenoscyphus fraxineus TaxID=746836 RepID=A0A9N9L7N7_9HELO|nr:hypothetical protein HYFRA_00012563 [Hymenoscyphus fraxineus]
MFTASQVPFPDGLDPMYWDLGNLSAQDSDFIPSLGDPSGASSVTTPPPESKAPLSDPKTYLLRESQNGNLYPYDNLYTFNTCSTTSSACWRSLPMSTTECLLDGREWDLAKVFSGYTSVIHRKVTDGIYCIEWKNVITRQEISICEIMHCDPLESLLDCLPSYFWRQPLGIIFDEPTFQEYSITVSKSLKLENILEMLESNKPLGNVFLYGQARTCRVDIRRALGLTDLVPAVMYIFFQASDSFEEHLQFGKYYQSMPASRQCLLKRLCSSLGIHSRDSDFTIEQRGRLSAGALHGTCLCGHIFITFPGHLFKVQITSYRLHRVIYHLHGAPMNWIIVPFSEKTKFERFLGDEIPEWKAQTPTCSQHVNHLNCWIDPAKLRSWNVRYFDVKQQKDQALLLFPDTYYWAWGEGYSIIESAYHLGEGWSLGKTEYGANYTECEFPGSNGEGYSEKICKFHPWSRTTFGSQEKPPFVPDDYFAHSNEWKSGDINASGSTTKAFDSQERSPIVAAEAAKQSEFGGLDAEGGTDNNHYEYPGYQLPNTWISGDMNTSDSTEEGFNSLEGLSSFLGETSNQTDSVELSVEDAIENYSKAWVHALMVGDLNLYMIL